MGINGTYPRPDFDRSHRWLSLHGEWDFAPDPDDRGQVEGWDQPGTAPWSTRIVVPFPWESPRSGVGRHWLPVGWYQRTIRRPAAWANERAILHVGAACETCRVWLNGRAVGEHTGGYLPFSIDLTDALQDGQGELVIRVEAPLDKRFIPHGKQHSRPPDDYDGCCFTPSSGIWQPVWLEGRPATYIEHVDLRPTRDLSGIAVSVRMAGPHWSNATLALAVDGGSTRTLTVDESDVTTTIPLADPILWSPRTPHLYRVEARLSGADGEDRVGSVTGLRTIEVQGDRLLLNGAPLYVRGVLDQGFWPECGYAAPDDGALRRDVELTLAAGYNLARKHVKLADPRWLHCADRLGLLVWAEPPCVGRYTPEAIARFEAQLAPWIARDGNHPSIILWGLYNEEWGLDWRVSEDAEKQAAIERAYDIVHGLNHSRPIIDNSGWWHVKTDVLDWHYYDHDLRRWAETTAAVAGDPQAWFGHQIGPERWYETQLSVAGRDHASLPLLNGEYGSGSTPRERGWHLRWQTQELRRHARFCGYLYTELYDIEHELCGIYTDTRAPKDLGCDPATVNAETVVIFDMIPERPGGDLITADGAVTVNVRLSHHGADPIAGHLEWGWDERASTDRVAVTVAPLAVTAPVSIRTALPVGVVNGRLHICLRDDQGRRRASGFIDVVRAHAPSQT